MILIVINDQTTYLNYAPAADRNKQAIWQVLSNYLDDGQRILEIASGSGQHALYFTSQHSNLYWQCTELSDNRDALQINLNQLSQQTMPQVLTLNVQDKLNVERITALADFDLAYTANSLHIMSWEACLAFVNLMGKVLKQGGRCFIYGPFIFQDRETTVSNLEFDGWLREQNPQSGLRSYEALVKAFHQVGLDIEADHEMPANNRLLVFKKA